jgi:predicted NAD/FAD-binding protein
MNRLQRLEAKQPYFVTLDPSSEPKKIHDQIEYEHPMFTREALAQREKLFETNGSNRTWYAGAYLGNGFHEDAVRSAVQISEKLGCSL